MRVADILVEDPEVLGGEIGIADVEVGLFVETEER